MAIIANPEDASKISAQAVEALLDRAKLKIAPDDLDDWCTLLGAFDDAAKSLLAQEDFIPQVDLNAYPRENIFYPKDAVESDEGGWATRCSVTAKTPKNDLLRGRTVGIKDNIAVAGVRCLNGTNPGVDGEWIPQIDATVVSRILDAGGIINGKTACENCCTEPTSDTSYTGIVHNPHAYGYSCGGSSSGSGRVVASGSADMALGCDQGGSVRIPSAFCGLVGLKPTWGLVPYSGILGLHAEIDHCGPMAKNTADIAKLLEAIAGPDGLDDRQPSSIPEEQLAFSRLLSSFLTTAISSEKPLAGFRIGLLKEGFEVGVMNANIEDAVRSAARDLASLGAEVIEVSVPDHHALSNAWTCTLPLAGARDGLLGDRTGRKTLYMTDLATGPNHTITQEKFDSWSTSTKNLYLRYLYGAEKFGPVLHAKAANLIRKYKQSYDAALGSLDAIIMPTLPIPAPRSFLEHEEAGPLERMMRIAGILHNTAPFDSTGHPAITVPVGFVPAADDKAIKLPAGMQIVCKHFEDLTCLKIGAVWEKTKEWENLLYGF